MLCCFSSHVMTIYLSSVSPLHHVCSCICWESIIQVPLLQRPQQNSTASHMYIQIQVSLTDSSSRTRLLSAVRHRMVFCAVSEVYLSWAGDCFQVPPRKACQASQQLPTHKAQHAPSFNDTFYGVSVSELACESLHGPSMKIAARMRVAADRGRFFSLAVHVKTTSREGEGEFCEICVSPLLAASQKLYMNANNINWLWTVWQRSVSLLAPDLLLWWRTVGRWASELTAFDASTFGTHGICAPWPST